MKGISTLLPLVWVCSAYSQQQISQCASNQECVNVFNCPDGHRNTDGSGLINHRFPASEMATLKKCTVPGNPAVIGVCCDLSESKCSKGKECVRIKNCDVNGNVVTDGSGVAVPRFGKGCKVGQTETGVCCTPPESQSPESKCSEDKVCVRIKNCDVNGNVVTDGSGAAVPRFGKGCNDGQTETGICCTPPPGEYQPASQCGVSQTKKTSNEAQFGEFPWQAIIFHNLKPICGASLIGDKWLLTAAHCVSGIQPYSFKVRIGEWKFDSTEEPLNHIEVNVASLTIHPKFNPTNYHYDIAVIKLEKPLDFKYHINSICLPSPGQNFRGQSCIATGWGKDAFDGKHRAIIKKIDLPIVQHHQCQSLLQKTDAGRFFELDNSLMCAGGEENVDACKGDGGGPLACRDPKTGQYKLAGITAIGFGVECGKKDVPGVYANVQFLLPFVNGVITS